MYSNCKNGTRFGDCNAYFSKVQDCVFVCLYVVMEFGGVDNLEENL